VLDGVLWFLNYGVGAIKPSFSPENPLKIPISPDFQWSMTGITFAFYRVKNEPGPTQMPNEPILIIDDNPLNLKLAKLLLEVEKYQVRTARSAAETFEVLDQYRPRLILMDFQLPGVDGLELTKKLKNDPRSKEAIVVMITSWDQKGDEEKAKAAGCDGYLSKPIDTQALPGIVAGYLRKG
jgi:CheY-like chemotaxis protein